MTSFFTLLIRFLKAFGRGLADPEFRGLMFFTIITLGSGTFFYHSVEKWNWIDSIYFCVITLTTVGYGDLAPKTDTGKIFTMIYLFMGLGILLGFINLMGKFIMKKKEHIPYYKKMREKGRIEMRKKKIR